MNRASGMRQRRSIRLKNYDYSQAGAYFVTICAQNRECLFGEIVDGVMQLNDAGLMVQSVWNDIPTYYPNVETDAFVVMPNHIHGVVVLVGATPRGRPDIGRDHPDIGRGHPDIGRGRPDIGRGRPDIGRGHPDIGRGHPDIGRGHPDIGRGHPDIGRGHPDIGQAQRPAPTLHLTVGDVVHRIKTMTTKRYADHVKHSGWPAFPGRLWQRNYYEHIIRDEASLARIREYISNNPWRWALDHDNPASRRK